MISGLGARQRERWQEARSGGTGILGKCTAVFKQTALLVGSSLGAMGDQQGQGEGTRGQTLRGDLLQRVQWAATSCSKATLEEACAWQHSGTSLAALPGASCLVSGFSQSEALAPAELCGSYPVHCSKLLTTGFSWLQHLIFTQVHFFFAFQGKSLYFSD